MKVLIFGTGKMSHALQQAFSGSHDVTVVGRESFDAAAPDKVPGLIEALQPDVVCNAVVLGGIDACEEQPELSYAINTRFPQLLASLSSAHGFHLLHISTDAVFSNIEPGSFHVESSVPGPLNMYGLTKFGADSLIPHLTEQYHIIRLPILFGPSPKGHQFFEKMLMIGQKNGALKISNDIYSCAAYSIDVASRAVRLIEEKQESGLYHVAGDSMCSLYDLIIEGVRLLDLPIDVTPVSHTAFPSTAIKNTCTPIKSEKIAPLRTWQDALSEYCSSNEMAEFLS